MRGDKSSHSMNPSASVKLTAEISCGTHSTTLAPTGLAFHEVLAYKIHGVASISQVLSTNPKLSQPVVIIGAPAKNSVPTALQKTPRNAELAGNRARSECASSAGASLAAAVYSYGANAASVQMKLWISWLGQVIVSP